MRIADVARRLLPGPLALLWAAAAWAAPGTLGNPHPAAGVTPTSSVMPSIEILATQTNLAGTCGGAAFDINTFINVDTQASADVHLSAPGFPLLEQFTDETGSNVGPFVGPYPTFTIQSFGGGLPPNTPIRITIDTYSGQALAGTLTYSSSMQYNCTTGADTESGGGCPGRSRDHSDHERVHAGCDRPVARPGRARDAAQAGGVQPPLGTVALARSW